MVNIFTVWGGKLHVIFVFVQISLLRYFVCEVFIRDFMGHQELIEMVVVMNFASTGKQFFPKSNKYIISIFLFNTCSCKGFFPSICLQIFYHFPNPFLFIQINSACRSRKDYLCFQNWFLCGYCVIFWEIQSWLSWRVLEPIWNYNTKKYGCFKAAFFQRQRLQY